MLMHGPRVAILHIYTCGHIVRLDWRQWFGSSIASPVGQACPDCSIHEKNPGNYGPVRWVDLCS